MNSGAGAVMLPELNNSWTKFPGSLGGGLDVRDLHNAIGLVGPGALQAQAGTALHGPDLPGVFPACSPTNYNAQTTRSRCYTFGDGNA